MIKITRYHQRQSRSNDRDAQRCRVGMIHPENNRPCLEILVLLLLARERTHFPKATSIVFNWLRPNLRSQRWYTQDRISEISKALLLANSSWKQFPISQAPYPPLPPFGSISSNHTSRTQSTESNSSVHSSSNSAMLIIKSKAVTRSYLLLIDSVRRPCLEEGVSPHEIGILELEIRVSTGNSLIRVLLKRAAKGRSQLWRGSLWWNASYLGKLINVEFLLPLRRSEEAKAHSHPPVILIWAIYITSQLLQLPNSN